MTTILAAGHDPQLLETRNQLLRLIGCVVVTCSSVSETIQQFQHGDFDLVLLCHTIPQKDREALTCLIRASGSLTPVVTVSGRPGQKDSFVNAMLEPLPGQFLAGVRDILAETRRTVETRQLPAHPSQERKRA